MIRITEHTDFQQGVIIPVDKACEWAATIISKDNAPSKVDYDFIMLAIKYVVFFGQSL